MISFVMATFILMMGDQVTKSVIVAKTPCKLCTYVATVHVIQVAKQIFDKINFLTSADIEVFVVTYILLCIGLALFCNQS